MYATVVYYPGTREGNYEFLQGKIMFYKDEPQSVLL